MSFFLCHWIKNKSIQNVFASAHTIRTFDSNAPSNINILEIHTVACGCFFFFLFFLLGFILLFRFCSLMRKRLFSLLWLLLLRLIYLYLLLFICHMTLWHGFNAHAGTLSNHRVQKKSHTRKKLEQEIQCESIFKFHLYHNEFRFLFYFSVASIHHYAPAAKVVFSVSMRLIYYNASNHGRKLMHYFIVITKNSKSYSMSKPSSSSRNVILMRDAAKEVIKVDAKCIIYIISIQLLEKAIKIISFFSFGFVFLFTSLLTYRSTHRLLIVGLSHFWVNILFFSRTFARSFDRSFQVGLQLSGVFTLSW